MANLRALFGFGSVAVAFLASACGDSAHAPAATVVPSPTVQTVVVEVDSAIMTVGSSATARAHALDGSGHAVTGKAPSWRSANASVASVGETGRVTAVAPGLTQIIATIDGVQGSRDLVVRAAVSGRVGTVTVGMPKTALSVGESSSATATVTDSAGAVISGRPVAWSIAGDAGIATVSESGIVTALAVGTATLIATVDSVRGTLAFSVVSGGASNGKVASVAITLPSTTMRTGEHAQAVATGFDSAGVAVPERPTTWTMTAGAAVATVSTDGLITAIAPGAATIAATIDGVTASRAFTVIDSTGTGALVTLPTLPTLLSYSYPTVTGKSWAVHAGDNLQSIINQAQRGDEIVLDAGATFTGNFTLPVKAGTAANGWILIRSGASSLLPPQGVRVTATQAALMPKLSSPNSSAALATTPSTSGWWISGVEFTIDPSVTAVSGRVVQLGSTGSAQNTLAQVPRDLVFDRVYIHPQSNQNVQRCLELNSGRTQLSDSYLADCHAKGYDSQAIVTWNGPGPFKIVNNTLAGAGETIMFGGGDPSIPGLVPSDAEIRGNYIYTPLSWKGLWTKKNLFETKNGQRLLLEGNVFEGSWADGQIGYAFVLKVANQSGSCTWCTAGDIIIRNNLVRNVGAGFGITGKEGSNPYPVGSLLHRLLIENNWVEDVNVGPYTGDARLVSIMNNASDVVIRNNTMSSTGVLNQYLNLSSKLAATNFVFQNNIATLGKYGFFSSWYGIGETPNLPAFGGTVVFQRSILIGNYSSAYPNAQFVSNLSAALATGYGADKSVIDAATRNVIIP